MANGYTLAGSKPSGWQLASITDMFWSLVNFIVLFFRTMINPGLSKGNDGRQSYSTDYRRPDGPSGPPRRFGGFRGGKNGPAPPPMAGGG